LQLDELFRHAHVRQGGEIGVVKGVVAELKAQLQQRPQTPSLRPL
jgi:hypothetical protein